MRVLRASQISQTLGIGDNMTVSHQLRTKDLVALAGPSPQLELLRLIL